MEKTEFKALVVFQNSDQSFYRQIVSKTIHDLPPGDVTIKVKYSSLNYKDALSASGNYGVTKKFPHTPGIDAAGVVVESSDPIWRPGQEVICSGYDLGMNTSGGFGQYIRVPGSWIVQKPQGISLLESMQLGTAGFTAAQCVMLLQANDIVPSKGQILVTGATGGVGSLAILLLKSLGYTVTAVTGKPLGHEFLNGLGVDGILSRQEFLHDKDKLLLPVRWAGAIDTVGGNILATTIKGTDYDGVITCCGNAASGDLQLSVYPFILRGVHLVGVYSANCPRQKRVTIWNKLASEWKINNLAKICRTVSLSQLDDEILKMLSGKNKGRCVVDVGENA